MSQYSNFEDNLAQHIEGFENGYDKADAGLYELSDAERSAYVEDQGPDADAPGSGSVSASDDSDMYRVRFADAPSSDQDMQAGDQVTEGFKEPKAVGKAKDIFHRIKALIMKNWKQILVTLIIIGAITAYFRYYDKNSSLGRLANSLIPTSSVTSDFMSTSTLGADLVKAYGPF